MLNTAIITSRMSQTKCWDSFCRTDEDKKILFIIDAIKMFKFILVKEVENITFHFSSLTTLQFAQKL